MNPIKLVVAGLLLGNVFISCTKDAGSMASKSFNPPPLLSPPAPAPDTVKGKEYIFSGLNWHMGYAEFMEVDFPAVETPFRPDLFSVYRNKMVWVQKDTGLPWVEVRDYYHSSIPYEYFFHLGAYQNRLIVLSNKFNDTSILGMTGSIKIYFP